MQRKHSRILSVTLALVICASVMVPALVQKTSALSYTGSDSYMSGRFYRALTEVSLTGDGRTDLVNVAKSQVGYQEGGSVNQLSGEVLGGVNFTEYGRWYGAQDMWCAMFASWCADVAGISTNIIPKHSYTPNGLQWFIDRGLAYSRSEVAAGTYTPQAGDLIYFKSGRNKRLTNHVGIVTGYADGRIYTIEGNIGASGSTTNGGQVAALSYPISNTYIVYICTPDYDGSGTNVRKEPIKIEQPAPEPVKTNAVGATQAQMETLRKAVYALETGGEACYDRITIFSGYSIAIGSGQWYGADAQELLRRIRNADKTAFEKLDNAGIGRDVDELDWNDYQISEESEKAACIRAILSSKTGIRVQDEMMDERLVACMKEAKSLGVTQLDAKMLCAVLYHLGGDRMVEDILAGTEGAYTVEAICTALDAQEFFNMRRSCRTVYDAITQ